MGGKSTLVEMPYGDYVCSICSEFIPKGASVLSCRVCDWDKCRTCCGFQSRKESVGNQQTYCRTPEEIRTAAMKAARENIRSFDGRKKYSTKKPLPMGHLIAFYVLGAAVMFKRGICNRNWGPNPGTAFRRCV